LRSFTEKSDDTIAALAMQPKKLGKPTSEVYSVLWQLYPTWPRNRAVSTRPPGFFPAHRAPHARCRAHWMAQGAVHSTTLRKLRFPAFSTKGGALAVRWLLERSWAVPGLGAWEEQPQKLAVPGWSLLLFWAVRAAHAAHAQTRAHFRCRRCWTLNSRSSLGLGLRSLITRYERSSITEKGLVT